MTAEAEVVAIDPTPISALTSMNPTAWRHWMQQGGAQSFQALFPQEAERILDAIVNGIAVEFDGDRNRDRSGRNLPIEPEHVPKVSAVIDADVAARKKAGPFDRPPFKHFAVSPIGAVPKKHSVKVRVIHHLSYPFHGDSVNAGIAAEEGKLKLCRFGHAARAVVRLGKGCWLIKLDVEAAYKQVPVRREDWPLLGFYWEGKYYYERVLPFGLRSSCRLWELFAHALHFLVETVLNTGVPAHQRVTLHYVDDFLFVLQCEAGEAAAQELLRRVLHLCKQLGLPMAEDKTEGPTRCLTFLGIELDADAMQARLPRVKLEELQGLIASWLGRTQASIKELQSLAGLLNFACAVVRPGRFYLRRIIAHTARLCALAGTHTGPMPLTRAVLEDVAWWHRFLPGWSGQSLLYELEWVQAHRIELFTDACLDGWGAVYGNRWSCGAWSPEQKLAAFRGQRHSMPFLELLALVIAAATWGPLWAGRKIIFRSDCMSVVQSVEAGRSKARESMHLLRFFAETACRFGFDFRCEHVAGVTNVAADALSRYGDCPQFRAACPRALPSMSPPALVPLPQALEAELQALLAPSAAMSGWLSPIPPAAPTPAPFATSSSGRSTRA